MCVCASLIQESKPAAAAAVVQRSGFNVWMLALPLSAVGRSLTVGTHTHTDAYMQVLTVCTVFLVGDSSTYCLLLSVHVVVSRLIVVAQEHSYIPGYNFHPEGLTVVAKGITICCSPTKCFNHFCTFVHLHAEQIFIHNFHEPKYLLCLRDNLHSVLPKDSSDHL